MTACAAQLLASGVRVSIAYPPDTSTPGYSAEQQTKARLGSRSRRPRMPPSEPRRAAAACDGSQFSGQGRVGRE